MIVAMGLMSALLASELPVFEFRGITTASTPKSASSALNKCGVMKIGPIRYCFFRDDRIAGVPTYGLMAGFVQNRLVNVSGYFPSGSFGTVSTAFASRYGAPCNTEESTWQNAMGARVPNVEYTWCFADGNLKLKLHGVKLNQSSMEFYESNFINALASPPKVDF